MRKKNTVQRLNRIQKFSLLSYTYIKTSLILWLAIAIFGFLSYTAFLQRQGFPQVEVPIGVVQGVYFVGDKNKVDVEIAQPLIVAFQTIDTIKSTNAVATDNSATIVVEFKDGTTSEQGTAQLEAAAKQTQLPSQAKISYRAINAGKINNKYDVILSLHSSDRQLVDVLAAAEQLAQEVATQSEVEMAEALTPFTNAKNPQTGEDVSRQTSYDWYGSRGSGSFQVAQSVAIGIRLKPTADIVDYDATLKTFTQNVNQRFAPTGMQLAVAAGFAEGVQQQIDSLQKNLLEGLLIVVLVCFIFIGFRIGLVAALSVLITLAISVGVLYLTGMTLNTITLFGLVLCLGLIVDDIVIMAEAIDAQRKHHKNLRDAIAVAAKKIALASTTGTLTTILGFAPLLFFGGILGKFIRTLPITIIISLLVSLFVSLTFVPFISRFLVGKSAKKRNRSLGALSPLHWFRAFVGMIGDRIAHAIRHANTPAKKATRAGAAIGISIAFLLATGPVFQQIKFDIFPAAKDTNNIQVTTSFRPNTTIEEAISITAATNEKIVDTLGDNLARITYTGSGSNRQAVAEVTLVPYEKRTAKAPELVESLEQILYEEAQAQITVAILSAGPPKERLPFKAQITATDPQKADAVAKRLVTFLQDKKLIRNNGSVDTIDEVEYNGEKATITRTDGTRIVEVAAGFDADDVTALVQATKEAIEKEFLTSSSNLEGLEPNVVAFDFGSESDNQEAFKTVFAALPVLLILMYVLLALQFRSIIQPLLILVAVPFGFFGVASGLLLTNNPFSFFVMVGFFALIGIAVNNTILLTDLANQARRAGATPREAMAQAIEQRARPLLTTSSTTVLALVPLALTDPFWESLAITLIGGLVVSTFLVVVSFPYYYLAAEYLRNRMRLFRNRGRS